MNKKIDIDIDRAVALYQSGMSLQQVAAEFGVSYPTVVARFEEAGIDRDRRRKFDVEKAAEMYRSGMSLAKVAAELDTSHETVRQRLIEHGTAMKPVGAKIGVRSDGRKAASVDTDRAAALYRSGMPMSKVAAELDVPYSTLRRRFRSIGVPVISRRTAAVDADRVAEMRAQGMTIEAIARELGVSTHTIHRRIHRPGRALPCHPSTLDAAMAQLDRRLRSRTPPRRGRKQALAPYVGQLREYLAAGWTRKEIVAEMRALGLSVSTATLRDVLGMSAKDAAPKRRQR